MLGKHPLLNYVFLTKTVIDIFELFMSRELIFRVKWMCLSQCLWALLQGVRLRTNNIVVLVCYSVGSTLTSVEVSKAFGTNLASENITCLQGCVLESLVLPCWW